MLPQYAVGRFLGGTFRNRPIFAALRVWARTAAQPKRPGLAAMTASSCPPTQEQRRVVQWRWDLSHASKLCSNAKRVEGFSTVWEQVP